MSQILSVRDLSFSYLANSRVFFNGLSFDLYPQTITAVIGQNGTGKSTLARLLVDNTTIPYQGTVLLNAAPLSSYHQRQLSQERIVLSQKMHENLFLDLSLEENWKLWTWRFPLIQERYEDFINSFPVVFQKKWASFKHSLLRSLSGGEQQLFAAQMLKKSTASLWLLDEYTSQLDVHHTDYITQTLFDKKTLGHRAIFMISHDIDLALRYCDQMIILHYENPPLVLTDLSGYHAKDVKEMML